MKIAVDTNVLVRAAVCDDPVQAQAAAAVLREAERVAVSLPCLCEFVWVLLRVYGFTESDVAGAVRALLSAGNVEVDRAGAEAGLLVLEAGGDFADGVIAHEGYCLGGETFVSFDKRAVRILAAQGHAVQLL